MNAHGIFPQDLTLGMIALSVMGTLIGIIGSAMIVPNEITTFGSTSSFMISGSCLCILIFMLTLEPGEKRYMLQTFWLPFRIKLVYRDCSGKKRHRRLIAIEYA